MKEIKVLERDEEYKILLNDKEKLICFQNELEKVISKEVKNFKFGVRPEDIIASKNEIDNSFTLQADFVELLGNFLNIHLNVNGKTIIASLPAKSDVVKDESLFVSFDKERIHLFDPLTEKAII